MRLHDLVETSERVAETGGRLEKIQLLAALLRRLTPEEIAPAIVYLSGALPQGRVGIGFAAMGEAMPERGAPTATLELREVDGTLQRIADTSGTGSAREKVRLLRDLLARATAREQQFLARLVLGELRQGALEGVMIEATASATGIAGDRIRRAVMATGDLGLVAKAALTGGTEAVARFGVRLFRPIQPMLAQPAEDMDAALVQLGEAALEYKLDGARVQVHKQGDVVRVYSRRLRDVTHAVPEVVEVARSLPAREAILDGEVIALRSDGTPNPFQVTMRRFGRKLQVERLRQERPLTPVLFDLLYADGAPVIDEPEARRFAALTELVPESLVVPRVVTADPAAAHAFLLAAIRRGHEGVMAKAPDAAYQAGSRGSAWLKVKRTHTLDLVVLAAEWGHGRRKGWLSNLHLGARDPEHGGFVMLGKTFKGMTDATLAWQTEALLAREIGRDAHTVHVRPELVVEVAFNDVQASPQYPGGVALRFARLKRYRPDKSPAEADTLAAVQAIHTTRVAPDRP